MKKLILITAVLFTLNISAQSIKQEKGTYKDIRLPLNPVDPSIKNYFFKVSTPYPTSTNNLEEAAKAKYEEDKANYPVLVEESKALHQQELDTYDDRVKEARENFKLESEEFKKLSLVERLAMSDQKPKLKLPSQPVYRKPPEPKYYEPNFSNVITFDPVVLADSKLKISGFEKGETNAIYGTIVFYDFESLDPVQKVKETSYYDTKSKQTLKKNVYSFDTKYKRPTNFTLKIGDNIISDGIYGGTGDFTVTNTPNRPNMKNLERESITNTLSEINAYLNSEYGFPEVNYSYNIKYVKNKKGEYDDLEEALEYAKSGYVNFIPGKGSENEDLQEAISIWEEAIKESNPEDRKARIDKKVSIAIYQNLISAYIATKSFPDAKNSIDAVKKIKLNYTAKERIAVLEREYEEAFKRFEANK